MSRTYRIECLSTALSPITHMSRTEGNEALISREPVITPAGVRWVPSLSGNALRHRLVREPGARFLVERWGLAGKLTMRQLNFLFHGGSLTESSARQDVRGFADLHRLFPLLRLIGGSLPDAILPGSLICGRGVLACRENRSRLASLTGEDVPAAIRPAEAFVEGYQYTRGDAKTTATDLAPASEVAGETNLMIFSGQSVIAGAVFAHDLIAQNVSDLEVGALLVSLAFWRAAGGTIGGQSARGHGRLDTLVRCEPGLDVPGLMNAYSGHVDSVRDEAIAWLESAFAPSTPKPAKGKKGAKADATLEDHRNAV